MMDDFGLFCVIIFLSSVFVRKDWKKLNMYFVEWDPAWAHAIPFYFNNTDQALS